MNVNSHAIIPMNPWSKPFDLALSTYRNLYAARVGLNELTDHVVAEVLRPP